MFWTALRMKRCKSVYWISLDCFKLSSLHLFSFICLESFFGCIWSTTLFTFSFEFLVISYEISTWIHGTAHGIFFLAVVFGLPALTACMHKVPIGCGSQLPQIDTATVINRIGGERKKLLDNAFVKWVCKSARPMSLGELDKDFRYYIQVSLHNNFYICNLQRTFSSFFACTILFLSN